MCGIAGVWNHRGGDDASARVAGMLDAMQHRGPDGRGALAFDGGAAGMVRLALVDLSDRGQQPLWSTDRRVAILFNGEIYNFRSERDRLAKDGYRFETTTDTEVVLALYLERGMAFVDRLRGMYAIAIFDWREGAPGANPTLVLVRGPLGIKPLYVAASRDGRGGVVFASELRAMVASGLVSTEVDRHGLADYLTHGFVVQPRTMLAGVRMMTAGSIARYAPGRAVEERQFWRIPPYAPRAETLDQAAERLRGVLDDSIAVHAFADAPVGAFLSGGVDSTGIVGLMRKHVPRLRTYTLKLVGMPGEDEAELATAAAERFGCVNTMVEVTGNDVRQALPRFAAELDQPSTDGLNTWLISRSAARDVKAVLSGVGGDEWFAGYPVTRRMARYETSPTGRVAALAGRLASRVSHALPEGRLRQRAYNLGMRRSAMTTWLQGHGVFRNDQARAMVGIPGTGEDELGELRAQLAAVGSDIDRESPVGASCQLDVWLYMGNQLLRDSDATSMASSLELRTPFVDVEVAAFARTCADAYKLDAAGGTSGQYGASGAKRVLIHALRDVLPADIDRRPKRGFALPFPHWMRTDLKGLVADTCGPETLKRRGLLDPRTIDALTRDPLGNPGELYPRAWSLMILELWCRSVLDAEAPRPTLRSPHARIDIAPISVT